jgi:hypothetical protein
MAQGGSSPFLDDPSEQPSRVPEDDRLGPAVVPLLLRDMEQNHTHWFCALREITGANPVSPSAGDIPQMVEAWLRWARDNGYRW